MIEMFSAVKTNLTVLLCPGLSDPFVIVELLPSSIFNCADQQTNVQKNTLNPVFEECFEL